MIPMLTYHRAPDCWPNCRPRCRSTWLRSYKSREKARLQSVCKCVARPAGDDEDGGHLSGVCREEECQLKRGLTYYLTADIVNRNYLYPVAPNSRGCVVLNVIINYAHALERPNMKQAFFIVLLLPLYRRPRWGKNERT